MNNIMKKIGLYFVTLLSQSKLIKLKTVWKIFLVFLMYKPE